MKKLLHFLTSVRLAVALIFILAALSLAGVFLPQIPQAMAASPEGYAWWVENVAGRELGNIAETLAPLGIFHLFRSVWFIGAVALLALNILACTAARIRLLRKKTQTAAVLRDEGFYKAEADTVSVDAPDGVLALAEKIETALRACRYSVRRDGDGSALWLAADKHRLSPWGTLLVHLSLILLLIGVLLGSLFGFRNETFTIAEGATEDVGFGTGLSVTLNAFTDAYWEDGTPKEYQSDVTIYNQGKAVQSGLIRVNHPLLVNGIRFHQGYFGPAAGLTVTGADGERLFSGSVALTGTQSSGLLRHPKGVAVLSDSLNSVILLGSAGSGDSSIGKGQIGVELYDEDLNFVGWLLLENNVPARLNGMTFTYQPLQYTGLMVSKEPGAPFLWTAAVLFLLGILMLFYFPHRRLWIWLRQGSDGAVLVTLKPAGGSDATHILKMLGYAEKPGGHERES